MLENAQNQAGRAGRTISDETLLLFETTEMITTERYPRTNSNWEDRAEANKIWAERKRAYKRAHAKERVKSQATEGSDKFGAENAAARVHTTIKMETNNGVNKGGMKALEEYFDNLAAAAVKKISA